MSTRPTRRAWFLPVLIVLLAALGWGVSQLVGGGDDAAQQLQGAAVQRGPLRISVIERGHLKAADSVTLQNELEGQTTILWLIDEGVEVQAGELLCELDTANLVDDRVEQEIRVQEAESSFVTAQQDHAIQISQNESDIAGATQELDFARLDMQKYLEGDMPQELRSLDEDILIADEELARAVQDLTWSEELAARGFLEQTQLDADRLAKTRAEIALSQAQRAKELYEHFEIPRQQKEFEGNVAEAVRELDRVTLQAKARIADAAADLRSAEATYKLETDKLTKIVSQIDKARLVAPVPGMVVYAVEDRGRWGDGEPMKEGTQVRERQDIITIPSSEGFVAEASLHESVLEKVDLGMACLVTVDALQKTFPGTVEFKAVLPDQSSFWANPDLRVYRTEVHLDTAEPRLRPGMSCSIEILVDELPDVTFVPVQAVFLDAGQPVCFVAQTLAQPERRSVKVGQNNGKWVEIVEGLAAGETVLLSLPPGEALVPTPDRGAQLDAEEGAGEGGPAGAPGAGPGRGGTGGRPQGSYGRPGGGTAARDKRPGGAPPERGDGAGGEDGAGGDHDGHGDRGAREAGAPSGGAETAAAASESEGQGEGAGGDEAAPSGGDAPR